MPGGYVFVLLIIYDPEIPVNAGGDILFEPFEKAFTEMAEMQDFYVREALPREHYEISAIERMERLGVQAMPEGELLIACLGMGEEKARSLLEEYPLQQLVSFPLADLQKLIGKRRARILLSSLELSRRILGQGLGIKPVICSPIDVLPLLAEIREEKKEHFLCLYLNARNQVIHKEIISIGSLSSSIVHPREVFQVAIEHSSASIVLSHNHPSGDVSPSQDDIELTRRLVRAGEIMGIDILDHIIIGVDDFVSLKERGLI